MMEKVTFYPSEQYAQEHTRAFNLRIGYSIIVLPVTFWFLSATVPPFFSMFFRISLVWQIILAVIFVTILSMGAFSHKKTTRQQIVKFQQQQITLDNASLIWHKDEKVQTIPYADIAQLVVSRGRDGRTQHLELHLNHTREKVSYFDDMDKMADLLETHLPSHTERKHQTAYVNWENPFIISLVMVGGWLLGLLLVKRFYVDGGLFIFIGMTSGLSALYQYWASPATPVLTKANRRSRRLLISGTVAFYVGLWLLFALADYSSNHECHPFRRMVGQSSCIAIFEGGESIAFMPNQPTLILQNFEVVWLQSVPDRWYSIPRLLRHDDWVEGFVLSADGQRLISWDNGWQSDGEVWIWNTQEGALHTRQPMGINSLFEQVALHPTGKILAVAHRDKLAEVWNVDSWQQLTSLPEATAVAFSPNGTLLATAPADRESAIQLWRLADLTLVQTLNIAEEGAHFIRHITFSPDGQWVVANTLRGMYAWPLGADADSLTWLNELGELDTAPAFSPTGNLLAAGVRTAEGDGSIDVWSVADGTLLATIPLGYDSPRSVAFSSDGELLAVGTFRRAMVFQMDKVLP